MTNYEWQMTDETPELLIGRRPGESELQSYQFANDE
jgi:hypothetical protein